MTGGEGEKEKEKCRDGKGREREMKGKGIGRKVQRAEKIRKNRNRRYRGGGRKGEEIEGKEKGGKGTGEERAQQRGATEVAIAGLGRWSSAHSPYRSEHLAPSRRGERATPALPPAGEKVRFPLTRRPALEDTEGGEGYAICSRVYG